MSQFVPEEYKSEGGFSLVGLPILLAALCDGGRPGLVGQLHRPMVLSHFPLPHCHRGAGWS